MSEEQVVLIPKSPTYLVEGRFKNMIGGEYCFQENCGPNCSFHGKCDSVEETIDVAQEPNVRKALIARPGCVLVAADWKGVELRVACNFSREPIWVNAFQSGADLHSETAERIFGKGFTSLQRAQAKCLRASTEMKVRRYVHGGRGQVSTTEGAVRIGLVAGELVLLAESGAEVVDALGLRRRKLASEVIVGDFLLNDPFRVDAKIKTAPLLGKRSHFLREGLTTRQAKVVYTEKLAGERVRSVAFSDETFTCDAVESISFSTMFFDEHYPGVFRPIRNMQVETRYGFRTAAYLYFDGVQDYWQIKSGDVKIGATGKHPFLIRRAQEIGWIRAADMDPNTDQICVWNGTSLAWKSFTMQPPVKLKPKEQRKFELAEKPLPSRDQMFDLVVPSVHEYIANNVVVSNSCNFCVSADNSFVTTNRGLVRPGRLLSGDMLVDKNSNVMPYEMVIEEGQPTVKILYSTGIEEEYRRGHPVEVWNGTMREWKKVEDLTLEDQIIQVTGLTRFCSSVLPERARSPHLVDLSQFTEKGSQKNFVFDCNSAEWAYWFGLYLGDGCCTGNGGEPYNVSWAVPLERGAVGEKELNGLGFTRVDRRVVGPGKCTEVLRVDSRGFARWVSSEFGQRKGKRVPDWVFSEWGREEMLSFLAGLIDSDGKVGAAGQLVFQNTNLSLVSGCALVASIVGIKTHLSSQDKMGCWSLYFSSLCGVRVPLRVSWKKVGVLDERRRMAGWVIGKDLAEAWYQKKIYLGGRDPQVMAWDNLRRGRCKMTSRVIEETGFDLLKVWEHPAYVVKRVEGVGTICAIEVKPSHEYISSCIISKNSNLYGGSAYTLANTANIPISEAEKLYKSWWKVLSKLKQWVDEVHGSAKACGFVKTAFGRRRSLKEWYDSEDRKDHGFADRSSVSHLIQGCLVESTRVLTNHGYLKIGDLWDLQLGVGQGITLPNIKAWNGHRWCDFSVRNMGSFQRVDYRLSDGTVLEADARHIVKKVSHSGVEWTERDGVTVGDWVAQSICRPVEFVPYNPENYWVEWDSKAWNTHYIEKEKFISSIEEFWYWVGYYYGDGWWDGNTVLQIMMSGLEKDVVFERMTGFFGHTLGINVPEPRQSVGSKGEAWRIDINSRHLCALLGKIGLSRADSHTKRLPDSIFRESLKNRSSFIKGLFASDGSKTLTTWTWHLCQEPILLDMQVLLRSCGVRSSVHRAADGTFLLAVNDGRSFSSFLGLPTKERFYKHSCGVKSSKEVPLYLRQRFVEWLGKEYPLFGFRMVNLQSGENWSDQFWKTFPARALRNPPDHSSQWAWWVENHRGVVELQSYLWVAKDGGENSRIRSMVCKLRKGGFVGLPSFYWLCEKLGCPVHQLEDTYLYSALVEKTYLGREEVTYSLCLQDESHSYDSNGIISKNTCADLMKIALGSSHKHIMDNNLSSRVRILLAVHDEIVFEVPQQELNDHLRWIVPLMCKTPKGWPVQLSVDVEVGRSWGEAHPLKDLDGIISGSNPEVIRSTEKVDALAEAPITDGQVNGYLLEIERSLWRRDAVMELRQAIVDSPGEAELIVLAGGKRFPLVEISKVDPKKFGSAVERVRAKFGVPV